MVGEPEMACIFAAKAAQRPLETFRFADPAEGEDALAREMVERQLGRGGATGVRRAQGRWLVARLIDRSRGLPFDEYVMQRCELLRSNCIAMRDDERAGAAQAGERFAQQPAGKHVVETKRFGRVD